jgi:predicted  nucleic acid-binding Zn-ribbon protein
VTLEDRPAADVARLAEIKQELSDVQKKYMAAKSAADRTALQGRMMELMREEKELEKDGDPTPKPLDAGDK